MTNYHTVKGIANNTVNYEVLTKHLEKSQDLVKQKTIVDMYSISPHRIYKMEEQGLKRYQLDGKTVFYSIKEFEEKIKELSKLSK